jgi:hypothetical protein
VIKIPHLHRRQYALGHAARPGALADRDHIGRELWSVEMTVGIDPALHAVMMPEATNKGRPAGT